jgi:DNA-binding response OmpR family regulator
MGTLIFVVDNQPGVCELAQECLEAAGYAVQTFSTVEAGSEAVERPSLIVVGMGLLSGSSLALQCEFFGTSLVDRVPRIVLLDDSSAEHRLTALDSGADDCIVKPFSPRELVARVQAILRRSDVPASTACSHADLVIDTWGMKLLVRGIEVPTTTLEFRLIEYLAHHRGQVFTRDFLLDAVWGDMQFITPRSVDACIRRIREKIEPDRAKPTLLKTIRGVGYRLDAAVAWHSDSYQNCDCPACRTRTSPGKAAR